MAKFIYINCPNCKVKIKIDAEKKYHDCPDCKYEFKLDEPPTIDHAKQTNTSGESVFGKFMREKGL